MEEIILKITNEERRLEPSKNIKFSFSEKTRKDLNDECQIL